MGQLAVASGYDRFAAGIRPMTREPLIGQYATGQDGSGERVIVNRDGRPDDLVLTSVTQIGNALRTRATVADWLEVNMFVQDVADRAVLNTLDLAVLKEVDSLKAVCWNPHDRLDTTTELVRTAQARRVPPTGLTRLAAHPDEWAGVEHGAVLPLRLLSTRFVEHFDFYENRVAAQLVDRLRGYLERRIRELTELADGLANIDEYERSLHHDQSWRRRERLSNLLKEMSEETRASAPTIQDSLSRLKLVRNKVLALRGSPAYQHVNRQVRLSMRLTRTNLFTNDARYRHVGALWTAWAGYDTTARQQQKEVDDRFLVSYDAYVAALVVRVCRVLGFNPAKPGEVSPAPGFPVRLVGKTDALMCIVDPDGAIRLCRGDDVLVRVLAIGHDLSAPTQEAVLLDRLDRLDLASATSQTDLVVVYPGLRTSRADLPLAIRRRLHSTAPRPVNGSPPGVPIVGVLSAVVPVTPVEIDSEERLARTLRWMLYGLPMVRRYPPLLHVGRKIQASTAAPWLRVAGRDIAMLRRPSIVEQAELVTALKPAERRGNSASHARENSIDRAIQDNLDACAKEFALFETCPLCQNAITTLVPLDRDTFQCTCSACKIVWFGTRVCTSCTNHYPVIWPGKTTSNKIDADDVTLVFGADILSLPCASDDRGMRFQCPWCEHCAGMPECNC